VLQEPALTVLVFTCQSFLSSLPHDFDNAIGIELLGGLHSQAQSNLTLWLANQSLQRQCEIELVHGDLAVHGKIVIA
jgi:hypothetical protein